MVGDAMKKLLSCLTRHNPVTWLVTLSFFISLFLSTAFAAVNTGGSANTDDHRKNVVGYITNWDAWKEQKAGVPQQGALTHMNVDFSKYTILNFAFFGVAKDGSLHSGDFRNKNIYKEGTVQEPAGLLNTDVYSSFDLHILYGEMQGLWWINESVAKQANALGFQTSAGSSTWSNPSWGVYNQPLPLPLPKPGGAKGLIAEAHANGVKLVASIGGWSMCRHFSDVAASPAKRANFIKGVKQLIDMGFDGVDIDWEYPGPFTGMNFTGKQADYANFLTLMREIRAAIGNDKLLTAAFSVDSEKLKGFDWVELDKVMDLFNFMTYDFNGGWSDKAGFNSNVHDYNNSDFSRFNWDALRDYIISARIPREKVNMGIPFYGRGVICQDGAEVNNPTVKRDEFIQPDGNIVTSADYTNWPKDVYDGTPNYFFVKQKALGSGSGWTYHWDTEAEVPYLTNGNYFLSFENPESVAVKSKYIVDNGFGGTIVWTVYGDLELGGTATKYGPKLVKYSNVKSELVNKINEVFANESSVNPVPKLAASMARTVSAKAGASASFSVSIAGGKAPYTCTWTFGDGSSATGNPVSHIYGTKGTYPVVVYVADNSGLKTSTSATAYVTENTQPVEFSASLPASYSVKVRESLQLETTVKGGIAPYYYSWSFGPGGMGTGNPVTHTFTTEGVYPTIVNVFDGKRRLVSATTVITVTKDETIPTPTPDPVSAFSSGPYSGEAGKVVSMSGSASGGNGVYSYAWSFGDGASATGKSVSHTYTSAGKYAVRLTVTDGDGATATIQTNATITQDSQCGGATPWSTSATYVAGNRASHNGHIWEAKWWSRGNEPGTGGAWGPWKDLGICSK
jgi:GH18 family chitinase/chitodextrinase